MIADDSGVKFFDRKFVASNLRSQLRCPKCTSEYSHRHTAGVDAENHRPFLLPCGHNMCEHCLYKHRQQMDFKCAVCSSVAPPTLTAKDPNGKYAGNIRDYYELNYHVLGETNGLDYYRRYSVDTVNKSLLCSSMNNSVMLETKCSECGHSVAMGECTQCNAFYCKRCFETVHLHSRVLKTHIFQRLGDKQAASKGIRVGKNIFRLPVQQQCHRHYRPLTIYCRQCKRTNCDLCIEKFHVGHKTCSIAEMNHRYTTEIPASLYSIDAALLHINNGQMLVRNTKKKLGEYAAETLADISKHFRLLHGHLQNAELQAIEKLRESSLSPQMQLNEAMSQLNGYESILKTLRQMLHSETNDGIEVPQHFWLKEVIPLISEHLEKIPSYVNVTKLKCNPYHFTSAKSDLYELMERQFVCKFVDPQIEIHFNNELKHQSVISAAGRSQDSSIGIFWQSQKSRRTSQSGSVRGTNKKQMRQLQRSNSSSSNSMISSIDQFDGQQRQLVNTLFALDISNSTESMSNTLDNIGDWFKTNALVRVRVIRSPEDFYVQCVYASQRIRDQLEAFVKTPACLTPGTIVVGQQYIAYIVHQSESEHWHRALVSQKANKKESYHVFLPDIGLNRVMHCSNFRLLPRHLSSLPYAAVHCSLKQLMPSKGDTEWEPRARDFLKQLVENNSVHLVVERNLRPPQFEVDLITADHISVREAFLYTGLARPRNVFGLVQELKPQQLTALKSQRLPKIEVHSGDILMVQMLEVAHPQDFYIMPYELEKKRQTLHSELQSTMDHMGLAQLERIFLGRLQLACVFQWQGQWHRVCIEQMLPEGYVLVRLVDSGVTQKLYWDELFVLPQKFWSNELAMKCCLADVETLQANGYAWTKTAIAAFKQLTSNPKLQMEVIGVHNNVAHVALHFTRSGETNNVAAMLVAEGHCQSSGESSKVIKKLPVRTQLDADTRKLIRETLAEPMQLEPIEYSKISKNKRSEIQILYVHHPSEFYVTLIHFLPSIFSLKNSVQESAENMHQSYPPKHDWQPGDMCFVKIKAMTDHDLLWHRGKIVDVIDADPPKYSVRLRDIGELVVGVTFASLAAIDELLKRVSNNAVPCQLYGISHKDVDWSPEAIEFFKAQLQAYSSLHISSHGHDGDSVRVTLWGAHTEISGPFSPARIKYVDINETLVLAGWALRDAMQELPLEEPSTSSTLCLMEDDSILKACLESVEKINGAIKIQEQPLYKPDFEHNGDMPPLELLNDFNSTALTTGCTEAPLAWLQSRECSKHILTALPTNVNHQCEIFLSLASDEPFILHARKLLEQHFKPMLDHQKPIKYVVGQPVVVVYHLDNLLYRGIVQSDLSAKGSYKVYFVDYGNVEKVKSSEMLPYAPFPQLKAMCWRVAIYGVQPKESGYTVPMMNTIHHTVVMKLCSVRVVEAKGPNGLPLCHIKVGDMDIAAMMVNNDMAVRLSPQDKVKYKPPPQETLDSFKLFDELLHLGEEPPTQMVDHNNTTTQPPPAKKKHLMDSREMQFMDFEEDFDCKQAAMQQIEESVNFEPDDDDDDENDVAAFSDDYIIEEVVEDIVSEDDNESPSPELEQASFMPPQNSATMDELRRRVHLRYKQERLESAHFSPLDTSTERSYHDDVSCFKQQTLPTGVKHFECIIDKVLSATELQITPQLTEFAKREIGLAQETNALIRDAPQLHPVQLDALCLARYTLDNQWYRAIIKELHQSSQMATVFYIDFQNTEMVPCGELKAMPKELFMFPLRSFRVKLHGIKMNKNFGETSVRHALQACLCKCPVVFARVHYPRYYNANSDDYCPSEPCSTQRGFQMLEVEIYESKRKTELLYKPLIDCRMYLIK